MRILMACLLLVACGGKSGPDESAPAPTGPAATPLRTFERTLRALNANGTRLTYRLIGDSGATPVVLVHGTLGDYRSWGGQELLFAQSNRVLVYSRRFHPPNPQVADSLNIYSPQLHADDLAALLLTLELAPAHIVGSSYGAYTALALAREHPELVRSVVLAEPPILPLLTGSEEGDAERRSFYTYVLDPSRRAFVRGDSVAGVRAYFDGVNGRGRFDRLPAGARADLLAHAFELRVEMLANREEYFPAISCRELGRVRTQVLLVRGAASPRVFQLISDELERCLQSDTTVTIPNGTHPPPAGNPAYYNLVVLRYLASH